MCVTRSPPVQNTEAERQACEIRLRAERRCGELLSGEVERAERGRPAKTSNDTTLLDLGIYAGSPALLAGNPLQHGDGLDFDQELRCGER